MCDRLPSTAHASELLVQRQSRPPRPSRTRARGARIRSPTASGSPGRERRRADCESAARRERPTGSRRQRPAGAAATPGHPLVRGRGRPADRAGRQPSRRDGGGITGGRDPRRSHRSVARAGGAPGRSARQRRSGGRRTGLVAGAFGETQGGTARPAPAPGAAGGRPRPGRCRRPTWEAATAWLRASDASSCWVTACGRRSPAAAASASATASQPSHRRSHPRRDGRRHVPVPISGAPGVVGGHVSREQRVRREAQVGQDPQRIEVAAQRAGRSRPTAARSKDTYLAAQYARIRGRRGPSKAAVSVTRSW